jgi:hypothetical protein
VALVTSENGAPVPWTATTETAWIHLTDASGSTKALGSVARITYDANPGDVRQGLINYQSSGYSGTLTVTQAGAGYVSTLPTPTTLLTLPYPSAFAVDLGGNVYYVPNYWSDTSEPPQEWIAATGSSKTLNFPSASNCSVKPTVATAFYVNEAGTLVADLPAECPAQNSSEPEDITMEWPLGAAQSTLLDYGTFSLPTYWAAVTPDFKGNNFAVVSVQGIDGPTTATTSIYSDANGLAPQALATLPLYFANGFTGDTSGNLFVTGTSTANPNEVFHSTITKVISQSSSTSLVADLPNTITIGLTLDASGTFYFLVQDQSAENPETFKDYYLAQWSQSAGQLTRLSPTGAYGQIYGDGVGNIYVETPSAEIQEFTPVFVNTTAVVETAKAGSDQLPPVLPTTTNFTAVSDSAWLTITGQSDGVVSFSFTAATGPRTGHMTILGQSISVSQ